MEFTTPDPAFWRGKRVLLTGHTGFKGAWLALWLARLGAQVSGLALAPDTQPNLFGAAQVAAVLHASGGCDVRCDVRDARAVAEQVQAARPQIVLHLAAQALVRAGYADPLATWATNVQGTAHVLDTLREQPDARVAVVVTTDKVYRNREWAYPYREDDALGGHDPYSASKAAAELVAASYRDAFLAAQGVAVATARAGNVIGGGDWAQDRLIPDAVRAWSAGRELLVRNPQATRPWQHVLEPLAAYLRLAEVLWHDPGKSGAYNFGPQTQEAITVENMVKLASKAYPASAVSYEKNSNFVHEARFLALEIAKARQALRIAPRWSVEQAIERSMNWYRCFARGESARSLCEADITAFETHA